MPIRKKGDIDIRTSANGAKVKQTSYTFYSYDKKSAALYFNFREENGEPTDLANATIRLVFVLNDEKITPKTDDIEIWLAVPGTARYIIPESMLGREGKVTGYVYLEFSDGSHTDEGRFTFEIKQSMITDMLPEAGEQYVKDFEDIKADVQSTADKATSDIKSRVDAVENAKNSATKDIEKAKDDAESQIGDYMGEVESAKQDISSSASDVQSKASEASEDISNLVKTTEDARDNAESQIGDYVGEVESAKDSAVEDIDKALPKVEDKLEDIRVKVSEVDISDTNLLLDSAKLKSGKLHEKNPEQPEHSYLNVGKSFDDLSSGTTITISFDIETTELGINSLNIYNTNRKGPKKIERRRIHDIPAGKTRQSVTTIIRDRDDYDRTDNNIEFFTGYDTGQLFEVTDVSINLGSYAHEWKPNPYEIVTQDQYDKLANAIINLGGSL